MMDDYVGFSVEDESKDDDNDYSPDLSWMELYLERYNSGDPMKDWYDESELQEVLAEMCHWLIVLSQLKEIADELNEKIECEEVEDSNGSTIVD